MFFTFDSIVRVTLKMYFFSKGKSYLYIVNFPQILELHQQ